MDIITLGVVKKVLDKYSEPLKEQLVKFSKDEWEKFKIEFNIVFNQYLTKSYDKYSKIKTILYKTEPQYIYDFFEMPRILKKPNTLIDTKDVNDILDISNFIIIQGTGGIGKSTLLKHLFINELGKKDLIPIFIELKEVNQLEEEYSILDIIYSKLNNLGSTLKREYLEYALNTGCFLFLLDGYDEIISGKKDKFFRKLDEFCDRYTNNYFIISSRPYSEFVEFQRFTVLKVLPLSKDQAVSLIKRVNYENDIKERFIIELDKSLYDTHNSFASNPLLLNIMLLTFDNYAEIPEKLHLFYSNAFETLYSKHDATKAGYKREMFTKLSYDSFKKVFAYFCFMTYRKGVTEFTYEELSEYIKKIRIPKIEIESESYIADLINSLCVLYKEGLTYSFTHRSFQEYFTAVFFKELSEINLQKYSLQMIKKEPTRAAHDNVFNMLYDMMEEKFEKNILIPVLQEYESSIPELEDKYEYILNDIVHAISYDKNSKGELRLWLRPKGEDETKNSLIIFIYCFARKYSTKTSDNSKEFMEASNQLYQYLVETREYKFNQFINIATSADKDTIVNLLRKTWIGNAADCIINLKNILIKKIEENDDALENMFDLEEL